MNRKLIEKALDAAVCGDHQVCQEILHGLIDEVSTAQPEPVALDVPQGAIINGRVHAERLEHYPFDCEAGPLTLCVDWIEFRRCFEHLSDWAQVAQPATVALPDTKKLDRHITRLTQQVKDLQASRDYWQSKAAPVAQPTDAQIDDAVLQEVGYDGDGTQEMNRGDLRQIARAVLALRPVTKPLTEEQIDAVLPTPDQFGHCQPPWTARDLEILRATARATERAHKIGGAK